MVSILIPIYNYNSIPLVTALLNNGGLEQLQSEIICIDDASTIALFKEKNRQIQSFSNCIYEELSVNVGRSAIRNLLAKKARHENLVFLDCDVLPSNAGFIKNYVTALQKHLLVFGGVIYPEKKNKNTSLHYKYGKQRETQLEFITQNFAIKKKIFETTLFDETIQGYGFEDLLFYKTLKEKGIAAFKIENPVIHHGIVNDNQAYIEKEHESLRTLKQLYQKQALLTQDVKLLKYYNLLEKTKTLWVYKWLFKLFKQKMLNNLSSKTPSLFLFDLYRIGYFCTLP